MANIKPLMSGVLKLKIYLFTVITIVFMIFDRIVFDRDLYADGSCHFLQAFFVSEIDFPLKSRLLGTALLHVPFSIFSALGLKDYSSLRILWKLGYVFPFILSIIVLNLLEEKEKLIGITLLIISITLFYLPNSMFEVGEYTIIFAILPISLASAIEYLDKETSKSALIMCASILILSLTYEAGAIFGIVFLMTVIFKIIIKAEFKSIQQIINKFSIFIFTLFLSVFFIYMGIKFMPDWLKANAHAGISVYLTQTKWGALSDTFLFFQIGVVMSYLGLNHLVDLRRDKKVIVSILIFILCITCLFENHQPRHSYYSKTLFMPLYFILVYYVLITRSNIDSFLKLSINLFLPIFLAISTYTFIQDLEFRNYLNLTKNFLEKQVPNTYIDYSDVEFLNKELGQKYTWSWGQACTSLILHPSTDAIIVGEFDRSYPYPEIKNIINSKKLAKR